MRDIKQLIDDLDKDNVLNKETRANMLGSLSEFVHKSIVKYIKGQKEHGGNLGSRIDLDQEIYNEQIDLFWYSEAKKWKK